MKTDIKKAAGLILFSFSISCLFLVCLALREHVWKSEIVFYSYTKMMLAFTVMFAALMLILRRLNVKALRASVFDGFSIIAASFFSVFISYSFLMTFPVTIERSFSVYMLGAMANFDRPVKTERLREVVSAYFHDRNMVQKRIDEQIVTGSIGIESDLLEMTPRGRDIVRMNALIGRVFNLDMSNITPVLSDSSMADQIPASLPHDPAL